MRNRLFPLALALLLIGAAAVPARALSLSMPPVTPLAASDDEAEESEGADEPGTEEDEEVTAENCTIEDEEDVQLCAEVAQEEQEEAEADACVVEDATARVAADPGNGTVALRVRYRAYAPAAVVIDARLRGGKGGLHLGASHTRFRRSGTFRETFVLGEKRMARVLAAREFEIEVQAVNAPRYCRLDLNGALRRARRPLRADGRDRSGDPGRTRGR
jgi:hypothetical protein